MSLRLWTRHCVDGAQRLAKPMGKDRSLVRSPVVLHVVGGYSYGGAAKGAFNLHRALTHAGVNSRILLQFGAEGADRTMSAGPWHSVRRRVYRNLDRLPLRLYPQRDGYIFSPGWFGVDLRQHPLYNSADIIHLHWITNGFLDVRRLPLLRQPVVWTLRDMWAFTGGCHYTFKFGCMRYEGQCGRCPHLGSGMKHDLSWLNLRGKRRAYGPQVHPVSISHWLGRCAQDSSVFRERTVRVIHNCIDTDRFHPTNIYEARIALGLPRQKRLVLFGANSATVDERKGFKELIAALGAVQNREDLELVTFGGPESQEISALGLPIRSLGRIEDEERLALVYSAADLFVGPSLQEAFGKTVAEAMGCGTPVVAFQGTGPAEIVSHRESGYLAEAGSGSSLAQGIDWVLSRPPAEARRLGEQARARAVRYFGLDTAATAYLALYQELLDAQGSRVGIP